MLSVRRWKRQVPSFRDQTDAFACTTAKAKFIQVLRFIETPLPTCSQSYRSCPLPHMVKPQPWGGWEDLISMPTLTGCFWGCAVAVVKYSFGLELWEPGTGGRGS